MTIMIDIWKLH